MLPGRALARALALVGVAGIVSTGLGTESAFAGSASASPSTETNTVTRTITFTTSDTLLPAPAPAPTVTLTRHGSSPADTLTPSSVGSIPIPGAKNVSATFNFSGANPGVYDIAIQQAATNDTCTSCFTVQGFTPSVSGLGAQTPNTLGLGGSFQPFAIVGQNFAKGPYAQCIVLPCSGPSVAILRSDAQTPTLDTNATLTQTVTINSDGTTTANPTPATPTSITLRLLLSGTSAAPYDDNILVTNSDGKSSLCTACLHVRPQPVVTSANLAATGLPTIGLNAQHQQVVVSGHDFPSDSVVTLASPSGAPAGSVIQFTQSAPATVGDHQEITLANVDTTHANQVGAWKVAVASPSLSNKSDTSSAASTLTVDAAPTATNLSYDDPNSISQVGQGAVSRHVSVTGTGIVTGTHINFAGLPAGVTPSSEVDDVAGQKVSTVLDLAQNASTGSYTVTLVNPDGGTSNACAVPPVNVLLPATPCPLVVAAGPSITSIAPNTVTGGFTGSLVITGTNLHTGTGKVLVDVGPAGAYLNDVVGTAVAGTGSTQTITIPSGVIHVPADETAADTDVTVTNVNDGGSKTATGILHIANLSVTNINPTSGTNDAVLTGVTVSGSNFDPAATVLLRRTGLADIPGTNVVATASSLTANFDLTDVGPGDYQVLVTNPPASTHPGTAGNPIFTVLATDPTITNVSPDVAGGGASDVEVTITGTGFYPGSVVSFDNPDITLVGSAVVNSVTSITQHIAVAQNAQGATPTVTVTNSAGFSSNTANFTIDPAPLVVGVTPSAHAPGTFPLSVAGSGFDPAASLTFSDPGVHAANVVVAGDGSSLTANVTVDAGVITADAPVSVQVTVTNPDHGQATTPAGHELVIDPQPRITQATPSSVAAGSSVPLQLLGANFLNGATLGAPNGSGLTLSNVQFVSAGEIDATLAVASNATRGAKTLTLANPDGGSATKDVSVYVTPGAPTGLSVSQLDSALALSWTAPTDNGGNAISSYTIHVTPSAGGPTTSFTTPDGSTTGHTMSGLTNGTSYDVSVVATNGAGDSAPVAGAGTPRTVPATPGSFLVTPVNGRLDLSWTTPSDGGAAITGYTATVTPQGGPALPSHSLAPGATSDSFTSLSNGTLYDVSVVATNAAGDSSPATASATPRTVADAPTSLSVTPGDGTLSVSWAAPASTGGNAIDKYTVSVTPHSGGATTSFDTSDASTPTHDFSGLTNGTLYDVSVVAHNAAGNGAAATGSGTPRTVPSAPSLTVTPTNGELDLSWSAPANGGSPITGYTATLTPHAGGATVTHSLAATATSDSFTGLTNGTAYDVSLVAHNAAGDSPAASVSGTPRATPGAPQSITVRAGDASLSVSWVA